VVGVATVGTIVLVSSGANADDHGQPADWVNALKLVLGGLLLLLAVKQWRQRPRTGEVAEMPKWMQSVDHFTPNRAAGLGVALSAANPKKRAIPYDARLVQDWMRPNNAAIMTVVCLVIGAKLIGDAISGFAA
jgi:threonine/homoserine/homoserine lactone efflux protein